MKKWISYWPNKYKPTKIMPSNDKTTLKINSIHFYNIYFFNIVYIIYIIYTSNKTIHNLIICKLTDSSIELINDEKTFMIQLVFLLYKSITKFPDAQFERKCGNANDNFRSTCVQTSSICGGNQRRTQAAARQL